jgi:hypothetical protein
LPRRFHPSGGAATARMFLQDPVDRGARDSASGRVR